MNIKDYLHLYLGCEVIWKGKVCTWFPENSTHIQLVNKADGGIYYSLWNEVKPILRPLSDMTEEELCEAYNYMSNDDIRFVHFTPKATTWLLSKHFDLFGLIDAGLAIDKTKGENQ